MLFLSQMCLCTGSLFTPSVQCRAQTQKNLMAKYQIRHHEATSLTLFMSFHWMDFQRSEQGQPSTPLPSPPPIRVPPCSRSDRRRILREQRQYTGGIVSVSFTFCSGTTMMAWLAFGSPTISCRVLRCSVSQSGRERMPTLLFQAGLCMCMCVPAGDLCRSKK